MSSLVLLITGFLTFVELNCENLFDCRHDSLKNDYEYVEGGSRRWTNGKYWHKVNNIAKDIIACSPAEAGDNLTPHLPDLIALCEVENDSVMDALTRRSLLRKAGYRYFVTHPQDTRGIDVALLYRNTFIPLRHYSLRPWLVEGMRPTRDILYTSGIFQSCDTLHIFVLHAPSRFGGEQHSRPFRLAVANRLCESIDSILLLSPSAKIIVAGDFNDYAKDEALKVIGQHLLHNVTAKARGINGAKGTYRYKGRWESLDHIFVSAPLKERLHSVYINDLPFLTQEEDRYGGRKPRRTHNGPRYQRDGYSDHLPLVMNLEMGK